MAGKINVAGASIGLDAITGRATQTARTIYLENLTAAPTVSSTLASVTEYGATGNSRPAMAMSAPSGTPRVTSNTASLTIGPFTAGTGAAITHFAGVSAASGTTGDMLFQGDYTSSRTPAVGDSVNIPIGGITVQID